MIVELTPDFDFCFSLLVCQYPIRIIQTASMCRSNNNVSLAFEKRWLNAVVYNTARPSQREIRYISKRSVFFCSRCVHRQVLPPRWYQGRDKWQRRLCHVLGQRPYHGEPVAQVCCGGIYLSHIPQKNQQVSRVEIAFQSSASVKCFCLLVSIPMVRRFVCPKGFLAPQEPSLTMDFKDLGASWQGERAP